MNDVRKNGYIIGGYRDEDIYINGDYVGTVERGNIYKCHGWSKDIIGEYEDGKIYSGYGWSREEVGEYRNGYVYTSGWFSSEVGSYEGYNGAAAGALILLYDKFL